MGRSDQYVEVGEHARRAKRRAQSGLTSVHIPRMTKGLLRAAAGCVRITV